MHDDIDWLNASSDLGLVRLCREMTALAVPVEALAGIVFGPARRKRVTAPDQRRSESAPGSALQPAASRVR